MRIYTRKPTKVKAIQWTGDNADELYKFYKKEYDITKDTGYGKEIRFIGGLWLWKDSYLVKENNKFSIWGSQKFEEEYEEVEIKEKTPDWMRGLDPRNNLRKF